MRRLILPLFVVLLLPLGGATDIASQEIVVELGEPSQVEVTQHYASIDTEQISYLVPSNYQPSQLEARDGLGELPCEVREFPTGKELLCEPRLTENYTVTITYAAVFPVMNGATRHFSYEKTVSIPTDRVDVQVILPEGYGLLDTEQPYTPSGADVGSEGRRIFVAWTGVNPDLGSRLRFTVSYEELAVLDLGVPSSVLVLAGLVLLVAGVWVGLHLRRQRSGGKTIASVFPLLKEDEQDVLRFVIDQEGEVEQREIVAGLDYSKAKISRLVTDLADRNLVEKQKQGRVNVVTLTREIGEFES